MAAKDHEFYQAIEENDVTKVQNLIDNGVSVNSFKRGMTPLQLAVARGCQEISLLLIKKRCKVTVLDQHCRSLFEESVMTKQWKVVASLLNRNISPDKPMSFGDSPLCIAVELSCLELVKVLVDGAANINSVNMRNETALYIACQEGEIEIAKSLIQAGADINRVHRKSNNFTPLLIAVANNDADIVKLLLQHNVNLNDQDADGWTSLWHAYCNSNEEICMCLLKSGASMDILNKDGKTVIEEAHENEDVEFIVMFREFAKFNPLPRF